MAGECSKEPPLLSLLAFDKDYKSEYLGRGSYGIVETVKFRGSICAIKHIHANLLKGPGPGRKKVLDDFLKECNLCSNIIHKNVVRFYGAVYYYPDRSPDIPSLVMEKMDTSLTEYIQDNPPTTEAWTVKYLCYQMWLKA